MEKKLLTIFGASGLVGSSILREALDRGYHVNARSEMWRIRIELPD